MEKILAIKFQFIILTLNVNSSVKFTNNDIAYLINLFKGRDEVFAIRWEKGDKSGYMPAYNYDPHHYRLHKAKGGNLKSYQDKTYRPLSGMEITKHLNGVQQIGIYPLLLNDTSHFLVADFDKSDWHTQTLNFLEACQAQGIPAYLERSRSGNGGHVWIFFEKPYPAAKSRKLFTYILERCGAFSPFDKSSSFDRLFPNQDYLSGKALGNLIALPLFLPALQKGNSAFIDPETSDPFPDQINYLRGIERVSFDHLEKLYDATGAGIDRYNPAVGKKIRISLRNTICLNSNAIPYKLVIFLKEQLNFANSAFIIKKNSGRNTFGTPRFFKLIEETADEIRIPRGFIGKLLRFCREAQLAHEFVDNRQVLPTILFSFNAALRNHQTNAVNAVAKKDFGVIVAPPGAGKTVIGLKIIADKQQPALIIVHRKQLLDQWVARIESFLGIPKAEIGIIGQGKAKLGTGKVTVATIQSIPKQIEAIHDKFGTILIDECHHIPAESFRNAVGSLDSVYCYGLTATPFRKYNDDKLIFTYLGDIITEIRPEQIEDYKSARIVIRNTQLNVPFSSKTDSFETLSQILIHDTTRNKIIVEDVAIELNQGKKAVIITERKEHIEALNLLLKSIYETVTLSGDDSDSSKKTKWKSLSEGNFQVLITTGQYFGEGSDIQHISTLFLAYPFSFHGKLIQYIGRVQRSEINPTIYDYRDIQINYLDKMFLKRNIYYRKISKQATLFDEPVIDHQPEMGHQFNFEKNIKIAIEDLSFHYGHVAFTYKVEEMHAVLEFRIDNLEIRPEFEVLKPYFIKILKSKNIKVQLNAEFEYGKLVAQMANSEEIERINKEIVEGAKFQFLNKGLLGKPPLQKQNILTSDQLQHGETVYANGEELLAEILKLRKYKHARHVQFLADHHLTSIMKIRFVLRPFAFVFLLSRENQYHVVLETLDTEEATYVWHTEKNRTVLKDTIVMIDKNLQIIREKGRQRFLEDNVPSNFSRVVHDYSDPDKGFMLWKALLEEILN
ncbi:DEAD/DEAH box helicase [Sphingobacterium sp. JB170]|uniref:DEAD/DEAH box helicase n=1 Tax=Sphingobacterium sp. JB170 TaxID=1434842 RepID=UPI00097F6137|nr:DEAD/DEAH box helicase [Sphingobacterium sp. JB170]SJN49879.1 DNA helicase (Rad25 homolog) [Sphingobacterium sp. JB170]